MAGAVEMSLEEIHRAAFELRQQDPPEAVRQLRRLVKSGGDLEPLAHGALAEILLEDFDDVDGAIHHFRRLLDLAPGMAAGELGLARALARAGRAEEAQEAYARALAAFESLARTARENRTPEQIAGADEAVLTALEIAVEERELCSEHGLSSVATHPSEEMLDWAESSRLFDDPEEPADQDDWIRFARLRCGLAALDGDIPKASANLERIGKLAQLDERSLSSIRSLLQSEAQSASGLVKLALGGAATR